MAKAPTIELDPQTARCVAEMKSIIKAIEYGDVALRFYVDALKEEDGLHREISLRVTFIPLKAKI